MVAVALSPVRQKAGYFYVWMAAVCALIAFGAFAPTYWLQLPAGTFVGSPLLHLHGAVFFAWVLFLLSQTALAANGHLDHHRAWGLVGISLATAVVFMGLAAALNTLSTALAAGYGDSRSLSLSSRSAQSPCSLNSLSPRSLTSNGRKRTSGS